MVAATYAYLGQAVVGPASAAVQLRWTALLADPHSFVSQNRRAVSIACARTRRLIIITAASSSVLGQQDTQALIGCGIALAVVVVLLAVLLLSRRRLANQAEVTTGGAVGQCMGVCMSHDACS